MAEFPAFGISLRFMVRAETAVINTFVCGFNVEVPIKKGIIPVFPSPDNT
jgi:hypothetical protein